MRRATNRVWVLACTLALTVLLAVAYHAQLGRNTATGMSAPAAPRTSIDSAPLRHLLRTQFEGTASNSQAANPGLPIAADITARHIVRVSCLSWNYSPLYRRPPPSLS